MMRGGVRWRNVLAFAMAGRKDACWLSMLNYCEQHGMKLNPYF
jgi:hypothetical protein